MVKRAAVAAKLGIKTHAHMLRHPCGYPQLLPTASRTIKYDSEKHWSWPEHILPAGAAHLEWSLESMTDLRLRAHGEAAVSAGQRWSHFLRQPVKVDSPMQRTIHHEDAETVFG
jgi:hypothetical protein